MILWIKTADLVYPSTAHAPRRPPYMAPVTEGRNASEPARNKFCTSVRGFVVQFLLMGENIAGVHFVPYDPPWYEERYASSVSGVPSSKDSTFPLTDGTCS
eukprot:70933_1